VIGGPLRTGRRRAIDQVIHTTAPMHDGFAGGALVDTSGALTGIVTGFSIRGTGVVIPARIAWNAGHALLQHGQIRRGYLGIAGQPAQLPEKQRAPDRDTALLVVGVTPGGPADAGGVLVGDLLLQVDDHRVDSPEDLLDLLAGERVGQPARLRVLRGGTIVDVTVVVGERPNR
jgi:S1-C subfamily serine protease